MTTMHKANGVTAGFTDMSKASGFRFQGSEGNFPIFVDMLDLSKTTRDIKRALICTLEQAKNVRRLYPETKKMKLVRNVLPNTLNRG